MKTLKDMIKLEKKLYHLVLEPLSKVQINHLFALDVVKQKVDGEIYVDDEHNPTIFYLKHPYGMSLLFGDNTSNDFNKELGAYLLNQAGKPRNTEYLQVFPSLWDKDIERLLGDKLVSIDDEESTNVILNERVNFKFNPDKFSPHQHLHSAYAVKQITKENFHQIKGEVTPQYFYKDGTQFEKHGVAFSVFSNEIPVSTAFAAFIHNQKLELGIETYKDFRGKGLAKAACMALIKYCIQNNYEPVWACRGANIASYNLALSLGFEPIRKISYYKLPCN